MTVDAYLQIPNSSIDDDDCPVDPSKFNKEVIECFNIVDKLPDMYTGMSGTYIGKDLSILPFLLDLYKVGDKIVYMEYILLIISINVNLANKKQQATIKLAEAQQEVK